MLQIVACPALLFGSNNVINSTFLIYLHIMSSKGKGLLWNVLCEVTNINVTVCKVFSFHEVKGKCILKNVTYEFKNINI